jgi:hypothetical protein
MRHFFSRTFFQNFDLAVHRRGGFSFAALALLAGLLLDGCGKADAPQTTELQSAAVAQLLAGTRTEAPGVQSTQAHQMPLGQAGGLGPTDYRYVGAAQLSVQALPAWQAAWRLLDARPAYVKPDAAIAQWPTAEEFAQLEFFAPRDPAPGRDGWIALDRKLVRVYFDFTTR